jgi:tripartite-type tricarboxylate transporter receptor subunit TctC
VLGVTGAKRSPFLPEVPTMTEQGYNVVVESYTGVFVPAQTPAPIVAALSNAVRDADRSPAVIDSLAKFGTEPAYLSTADFTAWIKAEIDRWGPVVKASGFVAIDG